MVSRSLPPLLPGRHASIPVGATLCCEPSPASPDLPVKLLGVPTLHQLPCPAGFTITPERRRLVQFVLPSYYSAGTALFAPGGTVEGVSSWEDLAGETVALLQGNYVFEAAPQTPALQNVTLLPVADAQGELGSAACRWQCWGPTARAGQCTAGECKGSFNYTCYTKVCVRMPRRVLLRHLAPPCIFPTLCRGFRSCAERQGGRLHRVSGWPVCPLDKGGWVAVALHIDRVVLATSSGCSCLPPRLRNSQPSPHPTYRPALSPCFAQGFVQPARRA